MDINILLSEPSYIVVGGNLGIELVSYINNSGIYSYQRFWHSWSIKNMKTDYIIIKRATLASII